MEVFNQLLLNPMIEDAGRDKDSDVPVLILEISCIISFTPTSPDLNDAPARNGLCRRSDASGRDWPPSPENRARPR